MGLNVPELLDRARRELLDLSTRNRLLSIPMGFKSVRVIQIYDEFSSEIFRLLVEEKKAFGFLPGKKRMQSNGNRRGDLPKLPKRLRGQREFPGRVAGHFYNSTI